MLTFHNDSTFVCTSCLHTYTSPTVSGGIIHTPPRPFVKRCPKCGGQNCLRIPLSDVLNPILKWAKKRL